MSYARALLDPGTLLGWWLVSFLLTLACELPLFVVLTRPQLRARRALAIGALGSAITHPLLWFAWPQLFPADAYSTYLLSGELLASTIEALLLYALARPLGPWRAIATSFLANAASLAVGEMLVWGLAVGGGS